MAGGVQVVADVVVVVLWTLYLTEVIIIKYNETNIQKKKNSEVRHGVFELVPAGAVAAADSDVKKKMRRLEMMDVRW